MHLHSGNIFDSPATALVNPVNTVGAMGRGLARQFREHYPHNYARYREACRAGKLRPGGLLIVEDHDRSGRRTIINFATKQHWRGKSRMPWIQRGLQDLREYLQADPTVSVALPPVGCGLGGLDFRQVRVEIARTLSCLPNTVFLYGPAGEDGQFAGRPAVPLKAGSALLLDALHRHASAGHPVTRLTAHQLTYLLQQLGGPYGEKVRFSATPAGLTAPAVDAVLTKLDGQYLQMAALPNGDRSLRIPEHGRAEVISCLAQLPLPQQRLPERLRSLIQGYESPDDLALLATTHLIRQHYTQDNFSQLVEIARGWLRRTAEDLRPEHVEGVVRRLDVFAGELVY